MRKKLIYILAAVMLLVTAWYFGQKIAAKCYSTISRQEIVDSPTQNGPEPDSSAEKKLEKGSQKNFFDETFRNEHYGYQVKFPSSAYKINTSNIERVSFDGNFWDLPGWPSIIEISVDAYDGKSLEQLKSEMEKNEAYYKIPKYLRSTFEFKEQPASCLNVEIDKALVRHIPAVHKQEPPYDSFYFIKDNYSYEVSFVGSEEENIPDPITCSWMRNMEFFEAASDWQAYRNEKYGYEISYLRDYSIFEEANQEKETTVPASSDSQKIFITDKPALFFGSEPAYLSVEVLDEYVDIDQFEEWINGKFVSPENSYRIIEKGETTFEGVRAYQVKSECGIDSPGNVIIINHRDKTYLVRYDSEECFPQSEKILSTFRFKE